MGVVHERESAFQNHQPSVKICTSFPSSSLSLLIVLHWLVACETHGVQLNNLGSNVGPNWKCRSLHVWLLIHSQVPLPPASHRDSTQHASPAGLDARDWPRSREVACGVDGTGFTPLTWLSRGPEQLRAQALSLVSDSEVEPTPSLGMGSAHLAPLLFTRATPTRDLGVSERSFELGEGGCSVSPKFEFLCFSWLVLNVKEFSVEQTCGERTLQKRCSWHGPVVTVFLSIIRRIECLNTVFLLLLSLIAPVSPSVCFYNEYSLRPSLHVTLMWIIVGVYTHIHTHAENFYSWCL